MYLDTHAVEWLYAKELQRFSKAALQRIEEDESFISPIVLLELQYLKETKRIRTETHTIIEALARSIGLRVCDLPFDHVVLEALPHTWTRDPFDRIIVGQAMARHAPLLTKDATIQTHYKQAWWDEPR